MRKDFRISRQGAPVVNSVYLVCQHEDVVVLNIDMKSKYCNVSCTGSNNHHGQSIPLILIGAIEESLCLHKNHERDDFTEITFPAYEGFAVMATGGGRYDIVVCLVNLAKVREAII